MDFDMGQIRHIGERLNGVLTECGQEPLGRELSEKFGIYCEILRRWNARTNLTAIRNEDGILRRHFAESVACARTLPTGIRTLLDLGSGAGVPGLPIALCRPKIAVTLAESQNKKAAFLQEVIRTLGIAARVHAGRAEALEEHFDCVTLRAVDQMAGAVKAAAGLVAQGGWLAVMTTPRAAPEVIAAADAGFHWEASGKLVSGTDHILMLGRDQRG